MLNTPNLSDLPGIRHGFLTRRDGVSTGLYSSLNAGFGADEPRDNVLENRRRALQRIGADQARLVTGYQIHSADVHVVTDPWEGPEDAPRVDALVTDRPNIALGVLTADCGPILFADPEAGVIGTAHAGWQGAFKGVGEATIEAMEKLGAQRGRIRAAIGPCIAQRSYEVGPEFAMRFLEDNDDNSDYFVLSPREGGRMLFDLRGYIRDRLKAAGLTSINVSRNDTYQEEELFFSYRRSCHRNEADYGRGVSIICLVEGE
ncbi:peptidoglycan editing factor PgeF [Kiloniella sp. b19]|uniref:peptidoglycan editing factor PgeF n=1 Tax=Kiloniella sp. GXU_MW_B19 TaxID=3141326 RepID=UPI0031D30FF2